MRFPVTVPVLGLSSFAWVGAACDADGCLRPLQGNAAAASSYCSTYTKTIATATTGFPSYIPTTCGPSRVSSVCTCLASSTTGPTTTAHPACSAGRVDVNPSFYGLPPLYAADVAPWTITHNGGSAGCRLNSYSYAEADHDSTTVRSALCKYDFIPCFLTTPMYNLYVSAQVGMKLGPIMDFHVK